MCVHLVLLERLATRIAREEHHHRAIFDRAEKEKGEGKKGEEKLSQFQFLGLCLYVY